MTEMKRILFILAGMASLTMLGAQELQLGYDMEVSEERSSVSADSVTGEDLETADTYNPGNSLYGLLSGLSVMQSGSAPWEDAPLLAVRGYGSFNGNNVLVVIDGVPGRDLSLLNAGEIENITVLKDAASLALYGNRAADGVIVITTRTGKKEGLKISADYSYSLQTPFRMPRMADNYEYASALNEALVNDGNSPRYSAANLAAMKNGQMTDVFPNVDWQEQVLRKAAHKHEVNFSARGGEKFVRYYVYANYTGYFGLFNNTRLNSRYSSQMEMHNLKIRSNIEADITRSTLLKVRVMGKLNQNQTPYYGYNLNSMYSTPALAFPVKAADGIWYANSMFVNPLADAVAQGNNIDFDRYLYADVALVQDFGALVPGMKLSVSASYDNGADITDTRFKTYKVYRTEYEMDPESNEIAGKNSMLWGEDTNLSFNGGWLAAQFMRFNLNGILDYRGIFGRHDVNGSFIYNMSRTKNKGANNTFLFMDFILRGEYSYAGKYFASVVANCSGSARLETGRKFRLYPAVSLGWLISNEDFMRDNGIVSHLKLKGSYGVVGYDGRLAYDMDKQFNQAGGSYIFQNKEWLSGLMQGALPSSGIEPETDYRADLGIELGLLDNNLMFSVDGFFNNRKNIACEGSSTISEVIGIGVPVIFSGETINYGAEVSAEWRQTLGDFSYSVGGNVSFVENRIIEAAEGYVQYTWQKKAGTQIGEMYGYFPDGFYQHDDFNSDGSLKEGVLSSGLISVLHPGDVKYKDLNADGVIDENDAGYHGVSSVPSIYYGMNLGFRYRNFGLQAMFQGAGDFMVRTDLASVYQPLYNNDKNISKHYLENRWSADSPDGRYPRLTTESNAHNYADSPVWWEKGDYLKLRNLYVWYDFGSLINGIESLRLFFRGQNLFSVDKVGILDPEHVSLAYPTVRSYQLGVKLTF